MSEYMHKSHNVSKLMYHFVLPAKYRKVVIDEHVDNVIKETCDEISKRYPIYFLEIGTDKDHVHFLIQSDTNSENFKEYNSEGSFCKMPRSKEKTLGRRILVGWILCCDSQ